MDISVSDTPVGRLLDGRYRVGERLARGGMATVYEAVDIRLDRVVALKIMHPEFAEDHSFVSRFIGEARSAARLSHPNVVAVFDQGEDQGAVYLAMEYVAGHTLRRLLREEQTLAPVQALDVLDQVLSALAAAHAAGIVHRDVKPENVLVGDDGRIKVADFGLARAVSGSSTVTRGVLLGTAAYISPEQALGEPATFRSDVYSAGVVLFELVTGHAPHDGLTDYVIVRKHIEEDVPSPSDEDATIPRAIDELVLRSTARDPERRFADAAEFLSAVRRARDLVGRPAQLEPRESAGVSVAEAYDDTDELTSPAMAFVPGFAGEPDARRTTVISLAAPEPPDQPRRQRRRSEGRRWRGPVLFGLVLVLAISTAVGAWWLGAGRYTTTPSLIQLTEAAAKAEAAKAGLSVRADQTQRFSERVPAGQVLQTDPTPGERIRKGGIVTLVLSKGPERYQVPDLVGKTRGEAEKLLGANNLILGKVTERYDEKVPRDQVISQETKPGTQVTRNSPVSFSVSKGRQPIEIKDFTGQPADQAKRELEEAGFKVRSSEEFSDSVPRGAVISQEPRSGTAFRGDRITLVVSKGPQVVPVPAVEGKPAEDAQRELEQAGFAVRNFTVLPGGPGNVLRQQPGAGTPVPFGSTITLWIF